jgi:hypothetical protein
MQQWIGARQKRHETFRPRLIFAEAYYRTLLIDKLRPTAKQPDIEVLVEIFSLFLQTLQMYAVVGVEARDQLTLRF